MEVVDVLLHALWYTEFMFRMPLHRSALILLADVGLELGWTRRSQKIIEEIMPQVRRTFVIVTDTES